MEILKLSRGQLLEFHRFYFQLAVDIISQPKNFTYSMEQKQSSSDLTRLKYAKAPILKNWEKVLRKLFLVKLELKLIFDSIFNLSKNKARISGIAQ